MVTRGKFYNPAFHFLKSGRKQEICNFSQTCIKGPHTKLTPSTRQTAAWVPQRSSHIYCKSSLFSADPLFSGRGHQNKALLLHETCIQRTFQVLIECNSLDRWKKSSSNVIEYPLRKTHINSEVKLVLIIDNKTTSLFLCFP